MPREAKYLSESDPSIAKLAHVGLGEMAVSRRATGLLSSRL